ncbi:hypothetical protein ABIE54_005471 [Chitinophagaceae bacterium OAS944]
MMAFNYSGTVKNKLLTPKITFGATKLIKGGMNLSCESKNKPGEVLN